MEYPFYGRKKELEIGATCLSNNRLNLIIILGKRGVGKTYLVEEWVKNKKSIYNLAEKISYDGNLKLFQDSCSDILPELEDTNYNYRDLINFVKDDVDIIIFDEYPYMIAENDELNSILKSFFDRNKRKSKLTIILLGSSISIMKEIGMEKNPLYGRITEIVEVFPMKFWELQYFFSNCSFKELMEIYGFSGGMPRHLDNISRYPNFWAYLEEELYKISNIKNEVDAILNANFTQRGKYREIIRAIGMGKRTVTKIANFCQMKTSSLSNYLNKLCDSELIEKRYPITDEVRTSDTLHAPNLKNGKYFLKEQFLIFYYHFIDAHRSKFFRKKLTTDFIKSGYSHYLGTVFEKVSQELIEDLIEIDNLGYWWGKISGIEREIDIYGFNDNDDFAIIGECKWSDNVNPNTIMVKLIELEDNITFRGKKIKKKYSYYIFALSFEKKISQFRNEANETRNVNCYDLNDLTELLKTKLKNE